MSTTVRRMSVAFLAGLALLAIARGVARLDDADGIGTAAAGELTARDFDSFARKEPGFPLLVPASLPKGQTATDPFLSSTFADGRGTGRTWMSSYTADALPPEAGNVTGYTVFQVRAASAPHECRGRSRELVRRVGPSTLTICLGPRPTRSARTYWRSVAFTDDYTEVDWLTAR